MKEEVKENRKEEEVKERQPLLASQVAGPMTFKLEEQIPGPFRLVANSIKGLFRNFKGAFKDKKRLVLVIVMSLIWLALMILPLLKIDHGILRFLNFLTFAQGGMRGGFFGFIGGVVGKGVFTYFISSIIGGIFTGKKPLKGIGGSLKSLFRNKGHLDALFLGIGIGLIVYNFFVGKASMQNSMIGIVGFVLSLRALSSKGGFIRRFVSSFGRKKQNFSFVNPFISGLTMGFLVSLPISAIPFGILPFLCGLLCLLTCLILFLVKKGKKKEAFAI